MKFHLRFYECEHQGDLNTYLDDVRACGGNVLQSQLSEADEEGVAHIQVSDFPAFKDAFQKTETADFCDSLDWIEEPLHKLSREQIEAAGSAMPETMKFHDQLIGAKLVRTIKIPGDREYPPVVGLKLNDGALLYPQWDDEGNPGEVEIAITDADGFIFPIVKVQDIKGKPVVSTGYFRDPSNTDRQVVPFVEFDGGFHVCAMCAHGGAVIAHTRGDQRDLLCQLRFPKS
jgi:hypothetical protein